VDLREDLLRGFGGQVGRGRLVVSGIDAPNI
jgi:hypothetical protein